MNHKFRMVLVLMLLLGALLVGASVLAQEHAHWTYEGEEGSEHWGDLSTEYALCGTGKTQSPIDINTVYEVGMDDIVFNYGSSALNILNNGHTVQVNYDTGSSIEYDGATYNLIQFHFHHPSEHTVDGESAPMEVHFVHRDANNNLAVVGVLLVEGEADNPAFADVFANLPSEITTEQKLDFTVNALDMLPEAKTFFTYTGSLTTPPCSEGVRWLLLDTPVELSAEQIDAFASIFELNARPVQPLNARDVLEEAAPNG